MLKKILNGIINQRSEQRRTELYRSLIRHEARIGGQLFGAVKPGGRREFFCLDEHAWVWHEEWIDEKGQRQIKTTRYDIRPNGIVKVQNGTYSSVSRQEAQRLLQAARAYRDRVSSELYSFAG